MHTSISRYLHLLVLLFLFEPEARATDIQSVGVPYVKNYSKYAYGSGNQNWSVAKGKSGIMYFGNSEGLLSFDGSFWNLYPMPNKIIVRAVATDDQDKVYAGGFGEFGYWAYNQAGNFTYHSLTGLVPGEVAPTDEIWKIYVDGPRVIFQSFARIYIYENGKIQVVTGGSPYLFLFKVGNRFFVEVLSRGLYELKGSTLHFIESSPVLGATGVLSILPYGEGSYLIGTAKNGLFLYDGQSITPWANQAEDFLKTNQLNNGALILGKYFAYGTILNGVIILNQAGHIVQQISKSSGLQNNTVLSLYTDSESNLWAGLDNGIDKIEVNSPLYFYFDKVGKFGTVYSSIIHDNKIYLGTNQGLFYSEYTVGHDRLFQAFDFQLIPNSQGQVWDLTLIDGQLLCGHNTGTFRVVGQTLERVSGVNGGWTIKKLTSDPSALMQGTYTGLVLYRRAPSGAWTFARKVAGFSEAVRYFEQDNTGHIWVSHPYKGVSRLTLDADFQRVVHSKQFGQAQGLPSEYNIHVFRFNNRLVFSSDNGFYVYDEVADKFSPYPQLNAKLGAFATSNKIIDGTDNSYWFINHGKVALATMAQPGQLQLFSNQFSILDGRMVQHYENISKISPSLYLISIDDGFVIYNTQAASLQDNTPVPSVLIKSIENITNQTTVISEMGSVRNPVEIPFSQNNIRISYALPYYKQTKIQFQYFLEGYSQAWSAWGSDVQKEFTNLRQGEYSFLVRAKVDGGKLSAVSDFDFVVLPPWYLSPWALVAYLILFVVFGFLIQYLYRLKLQRDKQRIKHQLEIEKEEYLKKQRLETEQKLVKLRNDQLQVDLASKSRELANSALNIVYKNELLQTIKDEVSQLNEATKKSLPQDPFKRLYRILEEGMSDEHDWQLFERSFNETHENYFKKLKLNHPTLTPNDLKLCAFLRMNMSSKEIASLLNMTVRSVELRRYRLRKRLSLEHETNLTEYLLEL